MVLVKPSILALINETRMQSYLNLVGGSSSHRRPRMHVLPRVVVAARRARDDNWLRRRIIDAGREYQQVVELFVAVYVQSQVLCNVWSGHVTASTQMGVYRWGIGAPLGWAGASAPVSFSKLKMYRIGHVAGSWCCYELQRAAMEATYHAQEGLVRPGRGERLSPLAMWCRRCWTFALRCTTTT